MGHRMKMDSEDDGFTLLGMNRISFRFFFSFSLHYFFSRVFTLCWISHSLHDREWELVWLEHECVTLQT